MLPERYCAFSLPRRTQYLLILPRIVLFIFHLWHGVPPPSLPFFSQYTADTPGRKIMYVNHTPVLCKVPIKPLKTVHF